MSVGTVAAAADRAGRGEIERGRVERDGAAEDPAGDRRIAGQVDIGGNGGVIADRAGRGEVERDRVERGSSAPRICPATVALPVTTIRLVLVAADADRAGRGDIERGRVERDGAAEDPAGDRRIAGQVDIGGNRCGIADRSGRGEVERDRVELDIAAQDVPRDRRVVGRDDDCLVGAARDDAGAGAEVGGGGGGEIGDVDGDRAADRIGVAQGHVAAGGQSERAAGDRAGAVGDHPDLALGGEIGGLGDVDRPAHRLEAGEGPDRRRAVGGRGQDEVGEVDIAAGRGGEMPFAGRVGGAGRAGGRSGAGDVAGGERLPAPRRWPR